MLLAYIWIGFFTITLLLVLIRTFVLSKSSVLYILNTISELVILLFDSLKETIERALRLTGISTFRLRLLKFADFASILSTIVVAILFFA